jgi:hypothetical protein
MNANHFSRNGFFMAMGGLPYAPPDGKQRRLFGALLQSLLDLFDQVVLTCVNLILGFKQSSAFIMSLFFKRLGFFVQGNLSVKATRLARFFLDAPLPDVIPCLSA